RPAPHSDPHHSGLFDRLRRIGRVHWPCDADLLAMHCRIRTRRRMVGRRRAGCRELAAAPSRQSYRAHAIRMGAGLHAGSRCHRLHPAAFRMACAVPHRTSSRAAHRLDPAQSERAAPLDRQAGRESLARSVPPPLARRTILSTALATSMLFAYWGLNTWLPGFLSAPRSQGGAGLNVFQTSAWIFTMQFGTFLGYASFGWLADWWGRRPAFLVYVIIATILTPIYGLTPVWAGASSEVWLLALGPMVGFF